MYEPCRCCQLWACPGRWILDLMMYLLLTLAVIGALAVAAALGLTPDTHREVSQHGDFRF